MATGGKPVALMQWMRRWGIARVDDEGSSQLGHDGDQPYMVIIRPGIAEVLGEAALARIALFTNTDGETGSADQTLGTVAEEGGVA
ncbi:MAG: hypothetical protein IPH15_06675 [Comamonadaceae bacterium]|nr:hypothetical protein [Comamonadaceae bacterium]